MSFSNLPFELRFRIFRLSALNAFRERIARYEKKGLFKPKVVTHVEGIDETFLYIKKGGKNEWEAYYSIWGKADLNVILYVHGRRCANFYGWSDEPRSTDRCDMQTMLWELDSSFVETIPYNECLCCNKNTS